MQVEREKMFSSLNFSIQESKWEEEMVRERTNQVWEKKTLKKQWQSFNFFSPGCINRKRIPNIYLKSVWQKFKCLTIMLTDKKK